MIGWIDKPPHAPFRCALTLQDALDDGPYYSTGLTIFSAHTGPHGAIPSRAPEQLYLSPQAFREAIGADGSPLVVLAREDYDADAEDFARLAEENADLAAQLAEARVRIAELEQHLSPDNLAEALVVRLDERYARKSGRKPGGSAA